MKLKTLSAAIALSLASSAAFSGSYIAEVSGAYADFEGDADAVGLMGEFFFAPVNTDGHPLKEAAFLEQASSAELFYVSGSASSVDLTITTLGVNFYIPDTIFFAGAAVARTTLEVGSSDDSENDWGLTAGVAPIVGLLVTTEYFDEAGYDFNLQAKYVKALKGETAFNVEASFQDADVDNIYTISGDYFFNKQVSLGANIVSADETGYGIQGKFFATNEFSIGAEYFTVDDADTIAVEAAYRF
ncbi:MAG: hypothetical protein ACI9T9_002818 [Oleiphilaceae bacterium]|jgi:hypothetical protein